MNVAIFEKLTDLQLAMGQEPKVTGDIHKPTCFIVTTHSPDANWKRVDLPATCSFCVKK